jgi:glycosyltransferase involved in cell wall biosynthesis
MTTTPSAELEFQLVLPCYNESRSLSSIITRARDSALKAGFSHQQFQLLLVENGSKDNSFEVLSQLKNSELGKWFDFTQVKINQGYGYGIMSGLMETTAPWIAWSHADEQTDPQDAFRGYKILRDLDQRVAVKHIVKGRRLGRDPKDKFVSQVFKTLARMILGVPLDEINAQPKVFHRDLLQNLDNPPKTFAFDLYVLAKALASGYTYQEIDVHFPPRVHGTSNWAGHFLSRYKTILGMIRYMFELRSQLSSAKQKDLLKSANY